MTRALPEWRGATPDTPVPDRVKARVFERYEGRCHWTGRKIRPGDEWDCDHILALCNGGLNVESNLAPILRGKPHREKTKLDVKIKADGYRKRKKHLGLSKPKRVMPGSRASRLKKKADGSVVDRETGQVIWPRTGGPT